MIERGLRWRNVGSAQFTWSDCWAVMHTLPFDAPLKRFQEPDEWFWAHPMTDWFAVMTEESMLHAGILKKKHKVSAKKMPHIKRPWEKTKEKLKATAMGVNELRKRLGFNV